MSYTTCSQMGDRDMKQNIEDELLFILTDTPKSRSELKDSLHCGDRDIRRAVSSLRKKGYNIASNSDTSGYWLGDEHDKTRTVAEYRSRAMELLKTAEAIEKGPDFGQVEASI